MELKVHIENTVRIVCGLTKETTVQDVIIALAHSLKQTGRFYLIEKLATMPLNRCSLSSVDLKLKKRRDKQRVPRIMAPTERPIEVLNNYAQFLNDDECIEFHLIRSQILTKHPNATSEQIINELVELINGLDKSQTNSIKNLTRSYESSFTDISQPDFSSLALASPANKYRQQQQQQQQQQSISENKIDLEDNTETLSLIDSISTSRRLSHSNSKYSTTTSDEDEDESVMTFIDMKSGNEKNGAESTINRVMTAAAPSSSHSNCGETTIEFNDELIEHQKGEECVKYEQQTIMRRVFPLCKAAPPLNSNKRNEHTNNTTNKSNSLNASNYSAFNNNNNTSGIGSYACCCLNSCSCLNENSNANANNQHHQSLFSTDDANVTVIHKVNESLINSQGDYNKFMSSRKSFALNSINESQRGESFFPMTSQHQQTTNQGPIKSASFDNMLHDICMQQMMLEEQSKKLNELLTIIEKYEMVNLNAAQENENVRFQIMNLEHKSQLNAAKIVELEREADENGLMKELELNKYLCAQRDHYKRKLNDCQCELDEKRAVVKKLESELNELKVIEEKYAYLDDVSLRVRRKLSKYANDDSELTENTEESYGNYSCNTDATDDTVQSARDGLLNEFNELIKRYELNHAKLEFLELSSSNLEKRAREQMDIVEQLEKQLNQADDVEAAQLNESNVTATLNFDDSNAEFLALERKINAEFNEMAANDTLKSMDQDEVVLESSLSTLNTYESRPTINALNPEAITKADDVEFEEIVIEPQRSATNADQSSQSMNVSDTFLDLKNTLAALMQSSCKSIPPTVLNSYENYLIDPQMANGASPTMNSNPVNELEEGSSSESLSSLASASSYLSLNIVDSSNRFCLTKKLKSSFESQPSDLVGRRNNELIDEYKKNFKSASNSSNDMRRSLNFAYNNNNSNNNNRMFDRRQMLNNQTIYNSLNNHEQRAFNHHDVSFLNGSYNNLTLNNNTKRNTTNFGYLLTNENNYNDLHYF